MCMICRECVVRTNRKHFLHQSDGGTDKYLRKIVSSDGTAVSTIVN